MGRTESCSHDGCYFYAGSWQGLGVRERRQGGPGLRVVGVKAGA
jgi:hypothetical protein